MKRSILLITVCVMLLASLVSVNAPAKAASLTAMVLASQLNVREGPGINKGILEEVNWGERLVVLGRNPLANWLEVVTPDGTVGWVSAFWVRLSVNISRSSIPIVS